jgi:lambda family phage portal protein
MSIFDWFRGKRKSRRSRGRRGFDAAKTDRFFQNWTTTNRSIDAELYIQLRTLRARSRDLAINDDYLTRFLHLIRTNVIGPRGIGFQNRAREEDGRLDTRANQLIEDAFRDWGRVGTCTVDGRLSWIDAQNLFAETAARDGEALVRMVKDPGLNRYGFGLQFVDVDHLDETFNEAERGGRSIRLSVEYDQMDRPTAYHLLKQHPNAISGGFDPNQRERVPADEVIHGFVTHRAAQGRGYPWTSQSLRRLKMLAGYEHAELIASRVGAGKMGFFTEPEADEYVGDDLDDWDPITNADPGTFDRLPSGVDFKTWDPDHPVSAYEAYVLAILRGAASGLGVSYVSLSGDLRGVSYSSIRQGNLDERDFWRTLQTWTVDHFVGPVFFDWLKMALLTGAVPLPYGKFDKFHAPIWRPRGWTWIDPLKEVEANKRAVANKLKSLQSVVGEQGADVEDILIDNAIAEELAEKHNTTLPLLEGDDNGKDA